MVTGDVQRYANILLGFVKCSPAWVKSWLPNQEERNALEPVEGGTYVLRHDDEGDKRHAVAVSPTWIVDTYMGTGGRDLLDSLSGPW
jgi:hypothetical protein